MPYTTVVPGTAITASWANANIRDQVITPFATATARDAAITSPVEGMVEYLADDDSICYYDGSAWQKRQWSSSATAGGSVASLTVSGIPTTIKSLEFNITSRGDNATATVDLWLRVGGDSGNNYGNHCRPAVNDAAISAFTALGVARSLIGYTAAASATAGVFGNHHGVIPGWDSPHAQHIGGACSGGYLAASGGNIWSVNNFSYYGTATRNSLTILPSAGNFVAGTRLAVVGTFV
jgi:hypothetical protein